MACYHPNIACDDALYDIFERLWFANQTPIFDMVSCILSLGLQVQCRISSLSSELGCICSQIVIEYELDDTFITDMVKKGLKAADISTNDIKGKFVVIYSGTCLFITSQN
jgi:hypothetical protein